MDLQEKLVPTIHDAARVVRNTVLLLRLADALGVPVLLTTQYRKGLGDLVPEVRAPAPGVEPLDKVSFGCFGDEAFCAALRAQDGRDQLLVAGVESHVCVAQTVIGAIAAGRLVHVAQDAVGSRRESNWRVGLSRMERGGAVLTSAEMAVYELLGRSDSAAFRRMLPHLKG